MQEPANESNIRSKLWPIFFSLMKVVRIGEISGRNIKNVSDDVKALINLGLVETSQSGRNKSPHLKYEKITLELAV